MASQPSDAQDQSPVDHEELATETEAELDPIALLGRELTQIRQALGLDSDAGDSSLLKRLDAIESKLTQPERERNLPDQITWSQAASRKFLVANKIDLSDISSGRVKVIPD